MPYEVARAPPADVGLKNMRTRLTNSDPPITIRAWVPENSPSQPLFFLSGIPYMTAFQSVKEANTIYPWELDPWECLARARPWACGRFARAQRRRAGAGMRNNGGWRELWLGHTF